MNGTFLIPALILFAASSILLPALVIAAVRLFGKSVRHAVLCLVLALFAIRILIPTGLFVPALIPLSFSRESTATVSTPIASPTGGETTALPAESDGSFSLPSGTETGGSPSVSSETTPAPARPASETANRESPAPAKGPGLSTLLPRLALAVWGGGTLFAFSLLLIPQSVSSRRKRRAAIPAQGELLRLYENVCREFGMNHCPRLLQTDGKTVPHLSGLFRPTILLGKTDLTPEELSAVFRHELVHYRRRDLWMKLILLLDLSVFWWNPLVWLFVRYTQAEMELACDEAVLRDLDGNQRCAYGQTILSVMRENTRPPIGVSVGFSKRSDLVRRFRELLDPRPRKGGAPLVGSLSLILGISCVLFGCAGKGDKNPSDTLRAVVSLSASDDLDEGNLLALANGLETPVRTGYSFTGWEISSKRANDGSVSVSFEPCFSPNSYTVRFETNGGTLSEGKSGVYTVESTLPTPVREGDAFSGWFQDVSLSRPVDRIPAEDCTLYAGWQSETPTASFTFTERDGEVILTGYRGNETDVTVPAYVGGLPVSEIGVNAFSFSTSLRSLTLPETVRRIGAGAFRYCYALESVTFGSVPTEPIDRSAFEACYALSEIVFPGASDNWDSVAGWLRETVRLTSD